MAEKIIILDFGSQFTQIIGRRLRELNVYCEIHPYNNIPTLDKSIKGVILSGSPYSVRDSDAPQVDLDNIKGHIPLLAVCYGAQYLAYNYGGSVEGCSAKGNKGVKASSHTADKKSRNSDEKGTGSGKNSVKAEKTSREYGRAILKINDCDCCLFKNVPDTSQVWMSHGDTITELPQNSKVIASTDDVQNAAYKIEGEETYALQFHPEVFHSEKGGEMLKNFVYGVCGCKGDWTSESFIESSVKELKKKLGEDNVILALSGGVDSSVAAVLLHKAIGKNLHCIFVDNGLLRKNEFEKVLDSYKNMGLNVHGVDASERFLTALKGVSDPEKKRKAIGRTFIEVFDSEAHTIKNAKWLAQGTIYPDVIESQSVKGPSATIKSHHNVGGLPKEMNLKIVEPLRSLFKDEVRRVGIALGIKRELISRHPFPGPGLGIRILGEVTREKLEILKNADDIYIKGLCDYMTDLPQASNGLAAINSSAKGANKASAVNGSMGREEKRRLYDAIWQAGTILLPIKSVGVMGDERTYEYTIALRAVTSNDGMTADWVHLPYEFLANISNEIINKVKGVNRVVYDISSKPPATIEWE
jgi:GMP synthase (glutamine-hydrolysing)